jgi:hypothetical protein
VDTTALGGNGAGSRRRFLQAVGLGSALSALPLVARAASAQGGSTTTAGAAASSVAEETTTSGAAGSSAAVTTTTAPPKRPTDADTDLLGFIQTAEVAAFACYQTALDRAVALSIPEAEIPVLQVFGEHHQAYAQQISGLLGRTAPNAVNASVLEQYGAAFEEGTLEELYLAADELERALTATNLSALNELEGTDGAALIASILAVEAQHSTVMQALAGRADLMPAVGVESTEGALTRDAFPVE